MNLKVLTHIILLSVLWRGERPASEMMTPTSAPLQTESVVGKLVKLNGRATIKRKNLRAPIIARRNTQMFPSDIIVVERDSSVKLLCFEGFNQPELSGPGEHQVSCPLPQPGSDSFTKLLNNGRDRVKTIKGPNGELLKPKANEYKLFIVKILNTRPLDWSTSITLDKPLQNEQREQLVEQIHALPTGEDEKRLLLAEVYALNQRYDRATEQLKNISGAQSDPFVQLFLGDLYLARNLGREAKTAYMAAVTASIEARDQLGEAYAQHALGLVLLLEGAKVEEATNALRRAIDLYTELGETRAAEMVQAELEQGQKAAPTAPSKNSP